MEKLIYGKDCQLEFSTAAEKFASIGFICNPNNCKIVIEDNATRGSYTDAYRIKVSGYCPKLKGLNYAMRDAKRINCNEFVEELLTVYGFSCEDEVHVKGNFDNVAATIPEEYLKDFSLGYNL